MKEIKKVISLIVLNESSTLSRIAGLFAGRGYNIDSLTVAPIVNSEYSNITISTKGNLKVIEQIIKQLNKLVSVFKVIESDDIVVKEMILVKFPIDRLSDIKVLAEIYNGNITNVDKNSIIVMIADESNRVKEFINASQKFNPIKIISGGSVAIEK